MKRVLALDPGDRVGWAAADIHDNGEWDAVDHGIAELKVMATAVVAPAMDLHVGKSEYDFRPDYDVVVCERWKLYKHKALALAGSEIPSAQFIGMVKLSCWLAGVPLIMQDPRDVNSNDPSVLAPAEASMQKLRPELFEQVMRPIAHNEGHDLVALKHLWLYTFRNYPVEAS